MTSEILIARHGFKGTNDNELTFKKGARITLISLDESGWAQGELEDGTAGWYPAEFAIPESEYKKLEAKRAAKRKKPPEKKLEEDQQEQQQQQNIEEDQQEQQNIVEEEKIESEPPKNDKGPIPPKKPERKKPLPIPKVEKEVEEKKGDDEETNPFLTDDVSGNNNKKEPEETKIPEKPKRPEKPKKPERPKNLDEPKKVEVRVACKKSLPIPKKPESNPFLDEDEEGTPQSKEVPPQKESGPAETNPFLDDNAEEETSSSKEETALPKETETTETNPFLDDNAEEDSPAPKVGAPVQHKPRKALPVPGSAPSAQDEPAAPPRPPRPQVKTHAKIQLPQKPPSSSAPAPSEPAMPPKPRTEPAMPPKPPRPAVPGKKVHRPPGAKPPSKPDSPAPSRPTASPTTSPIASPSSRSAGSSSKSSSSLSSEEEEREEGVNEREEKLPPTPEKPPRTHALRPKVSVTAPIRPEGLINTPKSSASRPIRAQNPAQRRSQYASLTLKKKGLMKIDIKEKAMARPVSKIPDKSGPQKTWVADSFISRNDQSDLLAFLTGGEDVNDEDARKPKSYEVIIRDYIEQMETILLKMSGSLNGSFSGSIFKFEKVNILPESALLQKLDVLRNILVEYSAQGGTLVFMLEVLSEITEKFMIQPKSKHSPGAARPSSKDKEFVEDDEGDESGSAPDSEAMSHKMAMEDKSPHAYLLGTQYLIIERNVNNPFAQREIANIPQKVLTTLFEFLAFQYSPAIRQLAGECLGLISEFKVDDVTNLFISVLKKSMAAGHPREYATYFLGISFLRLGFSTQKKLNATKLLFSVILSVSEKISRGVLRASLCKALTNMVEQSILSQETPVLCDDYTDIFKTSFYEMLGNIFVIVRKWVKSKTKVNGLRFMMTSLFLDEGFREQKEEEFLTIFLAEFKDVKLYRHFVEIASIYIQRLAMLEEDNEAKASSSGEMANSFASNYELIVPKVFLQKGDIKKVPPSVFPSALVSKYILDILLSAARAGISLQKDKTILNIISYTSEYHPEYKGIIFKAFSLINSELSDYFTEDSDTENLVNTLSKYFVNITSEPTPLRNIILCYPYLCKGVERKVIYEKFIRFSGSPDNELSSLSISAALEYLKMDLDNNFVTAVKKLLNQITYCFEKGLETVLHFVSPLCKILDVWQSVTTQENRTSCIEYSAWKEIRTEIESLFLMLVVYDDPLLVTKAMFLGEIIKKPAFVSLEEGKSRPYIVDQFKDCNHGEPSWDLALTNMLGSHRNPKLDPIFSLVFSRLVPMCNTSNPMWKNALRFLLLCCKVTKDGSDSDSTRFLAEMMSRFFSCQTALTGIPAVFSDIIPEMNETCYSVILMAVETEQKKELMDNSGKKKKLGPFYQRENVILIYSRVIQSLTPEGYAMNAIFRKSYSQAIKYWIEEANIVNEMGIPSKICIARILERFVFLEGVLLDEYDSEISNPAFSQSIFCLISDFVNSYQAQSRSSVDVDDKALSEYSTTLSKALTTLVEYATFDEGILAGTVSPVIIAAGLIGSDSTNEAVSALKTLIYKTPDSIREYVNKTFNLSDKSAGACIYLRAILEEFCGENFEFWIERFPFKSMVAFALIHLSSNFDVKAYRITVEFINMLFSQDIAGYREGYDNPSISLSTIYPSFSSSSSSVLSRIGFSKLLSDKIATNAPHYTNAILEEIVQWEKFFTVETRKCILDLLPTWAENFYWILSNDESEGSKFLQILLKLTCSAMSIEYQYQLGKIWCSILTGCDQDAIDYVSEFLISEANKEQNVFNSVELIYMYIVQTSFGDVLILSLVKNVCDYPVIPDEGEFIDIIKELSESPYEIDDDQLSKMKTAYILCVHLLFEHYDMFIPYLPLLLHNSAVMYSPGHSHEISESDSMYFNSVHCILMMSEIGSDLRAQALKLSDDARDAKKWNAGSISNLAAALSSINPTMVQDWARIALNWALYCEDPKAAVDSLHIFYLFTSSDESCYNDLSIRKLLLCFMKYTMYSQVSQLLALVDIFVSIPPATIRANKDLFVLIVKACAIALDTALPPQYIAIADAIRYMYSSLEEPNPTLLCEAMSQAWSDPIKANKVIMRGFFNQASISAALWLCETLSYAKPFEGSMFKKEPLLIFMSIVYCLLLCSKDVDAVAGALRIARNSPIFMKPMYEAFSGMDMRSIPISKHRDWREMIKDFMDAFYKTFTVRGDFLTGVDFVIVLLRRGPSKIIPPLLEMAGYFIRPYENSAAEPLQPISSSQHLQLSELIVFYMNSKEPLKVRSSIGALPTILFNIPDDANMRFYDCLREQNQNDVYVQTANGKKDVSAAASYFTGYFPHVSSLIYSSTTNFCSTIFNWDGIKETSFSVELISEIVEKSKSKQSKMGDFSIRKYRVPIESDRRAYDTLPVHVVTLGNTFTSLEE